MTKSVFIAALIILAAGLAAGLSRGDYYEITRQTPVAEILERLGDRALPHQPMMHLRGVSAENGRRLITEGFASRNEGGKTAKQSAHFVCTSCHNLERDEADLATADAQARLEYSVKKGLPMVQGSALYGVVNRTSFYNGDYEKKYGDLVKPARNDLRQAIQLCATECAQGRLLESWEVESILAYLWTIDLKKEDLNLTDAEEKQINRAVNQDGDKAAAVALLKDKYLSGAPATFVKPPEDRKAGYAVTRPGDPKNGKLIYDHSCLHCHAGQRYSYFNLNEAETSFAYLEKHIPRYTRYSLYQVARYGTSPIPGKRAYMPMYTEEKMTDQMAEDLRAYIEQEAK